MKIDFSDLSRDEIESLIDQYVICHRNAERNRMIYKRAVIDGVSQERIAEEFGLTPRQVQNIIRKTQAILLNHL